MEHAVVLDNVTKIFGTRGEPRVVAVDQLSLQVRRGEIFCLVGPDGAGKTTTIRMMCGVLPMTAGALSILGLDIKKNRNDIKEHIGYLSQKFSLYGDLTVDENIDFFAEIHRVKNYGAQKEELLAFTRLTPFRDRLAMRLSGGMKQKLALACTLVHTPDIIFLDEPTTGVDPVSRRDFWKILSSLLKSGITIVVTTPYLDEAERSTRVALMNAGRLLMCDTPDAVKASFPYSVLEVVCDNARQALETLQPAVGRVSIQLFGDRIHVHLPHDVTTVDPYLNLLRQGGVAITSYRRTTPSLEDVFIANMSSLEKPS